MGALFNLLRNSNENGIGAFVFAILIYLSFYHLFLFIQNKKKYYLFYSIFALFNAGQLFGVLENLFFEDFFKQIYFRNSPLFFAFKTCSYMLFAMFVMEITETQKEAPKFYKNNYISIWITIPLIVLFVIVDYSYHTILSYYLFQYFFFPLFSITTIVAVPLMLKFKTSIKYYLIIGVVAFNMINAVLYILTRNKEIGVENNFMFLFYASLLIENLLFTLALGKKERELVLKNNKIQEDYILQLNENQKIKEELNEKLEQKVFEKGKELELLNQKHLEQKEEKLVLELENLKQKIAVESLQNQMNPHFVFNALNSIKAYLIENDTENGIFYINKFSKLIRGILEGLRKPHISLKKEFELLNIYVKIESIRIKEDILFVIENNTVWSLNQINIPPLLLQPLVENAICHGFVGKKNNKKIEVVINETKEDIVILVKDNGNGMSIKKNGGNVFKESYGLSLVEERLNYFNETQKIPKEKELVLKNKYEGGLSVFLKIDKKKCLV